MGDDGEGLFSKFLVIPRSRVVGQEVDEETGLVHVVFEPKALEAVDRYFVLNPSSDQAALLALEEYARHCYPRLRSDISTQASAIRARGRMELSRTGRMNLTWINSRLE